MIPASMEDSQNVHASSLHKVEDLVRETLDEDAPQSPIVNALLSRTLFELRERVLNRQQELRAESGPLLVVPVTGFLNVGYRTRMDVNTLYKSKP